MKKSARNKKTTFASVVSDEIVREERGDNLAKQKMPNFAKRTFSKRWVQLVLAIIIICAIVGGGYYQLQKLKDSPDNNKLSSEQVKRLVEEVGEKIVLPGGEAPTIATVTDVEKLSGQAFFKNAQNGDKVLIFGSTKEAILYRESIHKIVAVSPINPPPQASNSAQSQTKVGNPTPSKPATKLKITILNSTKEVGLAKKAAALFDKERFEVVSTGNAKGEYEKTFVAKMDPNKATDADVKTAVSTLSKITAETKSFPTDEAVSNDASVAIILGKDFSDQY